MRASVTAVIRSTWTAARLEAAGLGRCDAEYVDISGVFEAGPDEPYAGSLEGVICGGPVEIPVSDFPRAASR